ncbi:hypothetical protein GCM10023094_39940 [Rhodococcus olei]|uniref:Beta-lactamase n=1 Tax=Rhodococcus olei TaxID=2161675 RepID=A0ABP8PDA6_9NOCA
MMRPIPAHFDMGACMPTPGNRQPFAPATRTPRILLTQRSEHRASVDGAWWPRTSNLTTELHDLITALTLRLGPVTRVAFNWNTISTNQRLIDSPDGIAVSGPIPGQPTDVMCVFGENGSRMVLAVIASNTLADRGYDMMREALRAGS